MRLNKDWHKKKQCGAQRSEQPFRLAGEIKQKQQTIGEAKSFHQIGITEVGKKAKERFEGRRKVAD